MCETITSLWELNINVHLIFSVVTLEFIALTVFLPTASFPRSIFQNETFYYIHDVDTSLQIMKFEVGLNIDESWHML